MAIILPTIIQGPCYTKHGGVVLYFPDGLTVEETVDSWNPSTTFGDAGERYKSRITKISGKPSGVVTSTVLNYLYEAYLAPQTYVGVSIFPASNKALTIYSVTENKTYGWIQAGFGSLPDLFMGPTESIYSNMSWLAIGAAGVALTNANYLKVTSGSISSLDTSFSPATLESDIFTAALGSLSSPYSAMGAMNGFVFKFGYKTMNIPAADVGIADIVLDTKGFGISAAFAPSNLTEAQVDTLCGYQGTAAVLPGQAIGNATNSGNLVVTGNILGWVFTATQVGAKSAKREYQIGKHRFPAGSLEFVNYLTCTTGVPNALFAFTAGS